MNIFKILFLLLGTTTAIGQAELNWARTIDIGFPVDKPVLPNCFESSGDGGLLCGITFNSSQFAIDDQLGWSYGKKDVAVLKLNEYGEATQIQVFGGMGNEEVISIKRDKNGDILVLGSFEEGTIKLGKQVYTNEKGKDLFLIKLDRFFEVKWSKVIGDPWFNVNPTVLNFTPENNIVIGGTFNSNDLKVDGKQIKNFDSSNKNDIFLIQLDQEGVAQWAKSFGGESDDFINVLEITNDGNILVSGDFNSSLFFFDHKSLANNGHRDIYLAKLDNKGDLKKAFGYGSKKMDVPVSLKVTNENKIVFSFFYDGNMFFMQDSVLTNPSLGGSDFVVCVMDEEFKLEWLRSEGNWNSVFPVNIDTDNLGNVYTVGVYDSPSLTIDKHTVVNKSKTGLTYDFWIAKWNAKGDMQYLKGFGGRNWEFSTGFKVIAEDEFVFAGLTESESLSIDSRTLKTPGVYSYLISKFRKQAKYGETFDQEETELNVYPTVTTSESEITVDIRNTHCIANQALKLLDGSGRVLYEKEFDHMEDYIKFTFNLPILVAGVYRVQLISSNAVISKTITVQ